MLKNLSIEWLKIKNYRTFWWLIGLFAICLIGSNYITYQFKVATSTKSSGGLDLLMGNPFGFPDVWQAVSYVSSFLLFLPGFLMLILMTNEYTYRTHRQNIIDGMSRTSFAITKIQMAVLLSLLSTAFVLVITVVTGLVAGSSFTMTGSVYLLYFLLQALTYSLGGLLLGMLLKRSGLSIAIFLIYIAFIKNLLAFLVNRYVGGIGSYMPIKSADELIPFPFFKAVAKSIITPPNMTWLLIMTLLYLAGFCWLILYKCKSQDL